MIRVAIVEDEAAVRDQLMGYVQRYMRQYDAQIEVTMFTDGVEILEGYRPVYDIIFLDVEMQHLDGMETASRIRALDSDVLLIFITNMAQYAIKGYAVGALDYVLKPVPYFAFSQQLQKAAGQLARRARQYLAVPVDGGMRRLDEASVYYIESEGHRIHFYTEDGDFSAPGALKAWEEKLEPQGVAVIIEAEHLCMTMRGVRAAGAKTQTSALRGRMKADPRARAEVLDLLIRGR